MPSQRSRGYALVDEKALQRAILTKIGHELQAGSEITQQLPRQLLALVMQIGSGRSDDE
jgi:membrane peptidoglycan carboxypeptidase